MKVNPQIKAILFDLDHTLLDSETAEYRAICDFKKMFSEFNTVNEKEFAKLWNKITMESYDKYTRGEISFETSRVERMEKLFSNFNIKIKDEEAKEKFKIYLDSYEKNWILFDDAIELLEDLKDKYKLAIVTNGDSYQQRRKIEQTGITKYFSEVIVSSEVGFSKPNKEIFEIACKKLDVKPEECIMIGDKLKVDIEGSRKLGMMAIWVNRKNENINYKYEIKELREVLKICK